MEKIKSFRNAKEFKEIFGLNDFGKRKNSILLSLLKSKELWELSRRHIGLASVFTMKSQQNLYGTLMNAISAYSQGGLYVCTALLTARNSRYFTDELAGLCYDKDFNKIRVLIRDADKYGSKDELRKTTPGKVLRQIIAESRMNWLPANVVNFLCEQFTEKWRAHSMSKADEYTLVVDDDFYRIYDSSIQCGDFHSCMNDSSYCVEFYSNNVKASAARLENRFHEIVARCVIFNECHVVDSDEILRLAERQYSTDTDYALMRILIGKLIDGGYIDGYKAVGTGCHEPQNFILNNGKAFNKEMWIECNATEHAPYMDSFKWYLAGEGRCYNVAQGEGEFLLENTDGWIGSFVLVYRGGYRINVPESERDWRYVYVEGFDGYVHEDDVTTCYVCGKYMINHSGYSTEFFRKWNDFLEIDYCCDGCLRKAMVDHFKSCTTNGKISELEGDGKYDIKMVSEGKTYPLHSEIFLALKEVRSDSFAIDENTVVYYG